MARKEGTVTISFTFEGRRYYVTGKDKTEAAINKALKLRDLEDGKFTVNGNTKVKDWAKFCFDTYKVKLEGRTRRDWWTRLDKNVLSEIGTMQIKNVKPFHCQQIMNNLSRYSKSHINKIYQSMNFIFEKALGDGLILINPAKNIERPVGTTQYRRAITDYERRHVLMVCENHRANIFIKLMLYCGLRPWETTLVQGKDVDHMVVTTKYTNFSDWLNYYMSSADASNMNIAQLMQLYEVQKNQEIIRKIHVLKIHGTKTVNADRVVPIPDALFKELPDVGPFDYLCTDVRGNKLTENSYRAMWEHFKLKLNESMGGHSKAGRMIGIQLVAKDLTPYCFRHTYCTDLQSAGVPINVAKELMGHSTIELTSRIYTHWDEKSFINAANNINLFSSGTTGGTTLTTLKDHQNTPNVKIC